MLWAASFLALLLLAACAFSVVGTSLRPRRLGAPAADATVARRRSWRVWLRRTAFWPLVPILAWNVALAPYLPPDFGADSAVPLSLKVVEMIGRAFAFTAPLLLTLGNERASQRWGRAVFVVATLAYFASWLPPLLDPEPRWIWLGPYVLPGLSLAALGLWARAPAYVVGVSVFTLAHVGHGTYGLEHGTSAVAVTNNTNP